MVEAWREPLLKSQLLAVQGSWERDVDSGGEVRHLVATGFKDLTPLLGRLAQSNRSRDFHSSLATSPSTTALAPRRAAPCQNTEDPWMPRPSSAAEGASSPTSRPPLDSAARSRRLSLALMTVGFATFGLLYSVQPLLPLLSTEFGVSATQASLAVSFTTGAMAFFFIPAAILSDRLGRRPVMFVSLIASALFTLASVLIPGWHTLLAMRALTGIALAGVPSVAMAYVSDEVEGPAVGAAMGLYIAGSAVGGMAGRLGISVVADFFGWRPALAVLGLFGLLAAALFWYWAPPAQGFKPRTHSLRSFAASTVRLLRDRTLPLLYLEGFLLMGAFVTIYNYVGFRLQGPPYSLSQATVGAIFLVYIVGSVSSAWFGALAGRLGSARVFWRPIVGLIAGILPQPGASAGAGGARHRGGHRRLLRRPFDRLGLGQPAGAGRSRACVLALPALLLFRVEPARLGRRLRLELARLAGRGGVHPGADDARPPDRGSAGAPAGRGAGRSHRPKALAGRPLPERRGGR